jgi:hypothetical protein
LGDSIYWEGLIGAQKYVKRIGTGVCEEDRNEKRSEV